MEDISLYLSKSRSNYLRSREEGLDLEILKETRLDYFRMLLLKKTTFNRNDFKKWCDDNSYMDLYDLAINDIKYLESKNMLLQENDVYRFRTTKAYNKLYNFQINYINRNEQRIDLLSHVKSDDYFNKLTIDLQNEFSTKILTSKIEIEKYMKFVSQNLTNTFGNTIVMYLQLQDKNLTTSMLREHSFWLNQKVNGKQIQIIDESNDIKILRPIIKDNKTIAYSLKKLFDISQTNINLTDIDSKKEVDFDLIMTKLEHSITNSNVFSKVFKKDSLEFELSSKNKVEFYVNKISNYYFFDEDEKELFNSITLEALGFETKEIQFSLDNIKNKLSNVISTFNIVSTELLLHEIINENNLEDLFYFKLGIKNENIDENSIISPVDRKNYLVGNNVKSNNSYLNNSLDIATEILEHEEIKINVSYENLFVSTKILTILSGQYKNESFSLDSDYSDEEVKIIVARDYLSKIIEKDLIKNSVKILGEENEINRNKQLFSREYPNDTRQLHARASNKEVQRDGTKFDSVILPNDNSSESNGPDKQSDGTKVQRTRSLGNSEQRINLSKIEKIPSIYFEYFKNADFSTFTHTKTKELLNVMKLNTRLSKSDYKYFHNYLSKNGIGYYSKIAKAFIISDSEIVNHFLQKDKVTDKASLISDIGLTINEKVNFGNRSLTYIGKNIYDKDLYQDHNNIREYTENDNKIFVAEKVSIIPGKNISVPDEETKFINGNFEYLTKEEVLTFSKNEDLISNIKIEAYKEILEELGYISSKFDKNPDEIDLNEYDNFLSVNYPKMNISDKNKYQDIIDSRIQVRAETLADYFGFSNPKDWLKYASFVNSKNETNVIEMSVFGVKDLFKEINIYAQEIEKSQDYINWKSTEENKKTIIANIENTEISLDIIKDSSKYSFREYDNDAELILTYKNGITSEFIKSLGIAYISRTGDISFYENNALFEADGDFNNGIELFKIIKANLPNDVLLKVNDQARKNILREVEQLNSLYLRKFNFEISGISIENPKIWNFITHENVIEFDTLKELSKYVRDEKHKELANNLAEKKAEISSSNLLSKDELEFKFKEHDDRLEVFAEHNGTYSLLLKQNIVLSVVIKEATSLKNLNEFYKQFDMKNYIASKGYYDESKHSNNELNSTPVINQIADEPKDESLSNNEKLAAQIANEVYDYATKNFTTEKQINIFDEYGINVEDYENAQGMIEEDFSYIYNRTLELVKNPITEMYFTNAEYDTGLDWDEITEYIPNLTIDSGVFNDGNIIKFDLEINKENNITLFYDEISKEYTYSNDAEANINILETVGQMLQNGYDYQTLTDNIIGKKIDVLNQLNANSTTNFIDITYDNDLYRIFNDTSIAEILDNKIINVLIDKVLAENILNTANITNKIKYSNFTNLPIGITEANYNERLRSFEKQREEMENGNLPINEFTFKGLYDKLQYILDYENKNNIISKRSLDEINKFTNNNKSHSRVSERAENNSGFDTNRFTSTREYRNISGSDEIKNEQRGSNFNNGNADNEKTSYFIEQKLSIKNIDNKKLLTDLLYKIRQDRTDEKIDQLEADELYKLIEDRFSELDNLIQQMHFNSICDLRSQGNKNYKNLLADYNNKFEPISEKDLIINQELLEKHRNISLKVLQSIYNDGQSIDEPLNEHNEIFNDSINANDLEDNFTIENDNTTTRNGTKTKFKRYISGIEIIRKIERNEDITIEDKIALSQMPGIGTIAQAFPRTNGTVAKGWEKESEELKAILSEEEYKQAARATLDAYYTDEFICKAMWKAIENFGYSGGSVLEPSMGIGNFFGYMPKHLKPNSQLIGIELDKTTAKVAQILYPKARIYNIGFQDFKLLEGQKASIVIGNPPYGSHKIFDRINKEFDGLSIHNYFMAKSVDSLENGGVLAMIVSNNFLDANDPTTRALIGKNANLLGAIRLPKGSFGNANTEIVTDIIFLQKREYGMESNISDWLNIGEINETPINEYFMKNPDYLLGEWGKFGTMYRGDEPALIERPGQNTSELLLKAIENLPRYINYNSGKKSYSRYPTQDSSISSSEKILEYKTNDLAKTLARQNGEKMTSDARINSLFINDNKIYKRYPDLNGEISIEEITTKINSKDEEKELTELEIEKIKGMIKIAEIANKLRYSQLDETISDLQLDSIRKDLNEVYDKFVKKYGYLNRGSNANLFEEDVNAPLLLALEKKYDKGISSTVAKKFGVSPMKETAVKADIFFKRTQTPYKMPTSAESYEDALHISLAEKTYVDMNFMSSLLNQDIKTIENYLSNNGFIFNDPNYGWVTREEYLSGNVKQKYKETNNPKNLDALEKVIPEDIPAIDIAVACGASWIPQKDINDFVTEVSGDNDCNVFYINYTASWSVADLTVSSDKESLYGTGRRSAKDIIIAALNNKQVTVYDKIEDGEQTRNVINHDETTAANDKVDLVKEVWNEWIWNTSDRRDRLAKLYNDKFNVYAKREYDGKHLKFPGKVNDSTIELRPHQKNAVWRVLQNGRDLFDHTVGSGKTYSAIASVMELKRTGKAKKPLVVVPNHLVQQWAKEWLELYPNANLLVPSKKDFTAKKRKLLMSRIATGEYDGVIIAHSQLTKIENDKNYEIRFLEDQIDQIHDAINQMREEKGKDGLSIKQWENKKDALISRMEKLLSTPKDDNLNFLELGIDAMIVDEAHEFKNLQFHTSLQRIRGLGNPQGSQKAFDMYIKSQCLLEKTNNKNLIFLTGTPISNSIAEMYTIKRYLMSNELKADGLEHFDAWAKQYADIKTDWELSASGKYKLVTRMSKFKNMPELIASYRTFADVITTQMVKDQLAVEGKVLDIPDVKDGKPKNVIVERSEDQANFIGVPDENGIYQSNTLVYRSENMPKGKAKKGDDNMLVVMSDAKKASLDMRLINPNYSDFEGSKVNECINDLINNYHKWSLLKGTQLIFCDLSTPKGAIASEKSKIEELVRKAESGDEDAAKELDSLSPDELDSILNSSFSVYDDVKEKLIKKGIPENEIAFIHDAKTDLQKQELFLKVNSGHIRFLMGSTSKMGAGTNVQKRLVNLGHLDVPWRPSDLEQREGRIIRQGNSIFKLFKAIRENSYDYSKVKKNAKDLLDEFKLADENSISTVIDLVKEQDGLFNVTINRYATKNTLDSGLWEKIEAKARFIQQLKNGDVLDREVEDISGEEANAAEMKAASSGNPLILEEMQLKTEIKKIEAVKKNFKRSLHDREERIKYYEKSLENFDDLQNNYLKDIESYDNYKLKMEDKKVNFSKLKEENKNKGISNKDLDPVTDFEFVINGKAYDKREEVGAYIIKRARDLQHETKVNVKSLDIGKIGSFDVSVEKGNIFRDYLMTLVITGAKTYTIDFDVREQKAIGIAVKMINELDRIKINYEQFLLGNSTILKELPKLKELPTEFPKEDELQLLKKRYKVVVGELQAKDTKQSTNVDNAKENSLSSIKNTWIDENKDISTDVLLIKGKFDLSVIQNIEHKFVGNCLVLENELERKDYIKFQKIFEAFGGIWDRKKDAIVFSDDGSKRMKDILSSKDLLDDLNDLNEVKELLKIGQDNSLEI